MMNRKEKGIKYKIRVGVQYLLISLLTTSPVVPGSAGTAFASMEDELNIDTQEIKTTNESNIYNNSKTLENDTSIVEASSGSESGTVGTCSWEIDAEGTLIINSGTFPKIDSSIWKNYSDIIKKIVFSGPVISGSSLNHLFDGLENLREIQNLYYLDTSNATSMMYLFRNCASLEEVDVSSFNTSHVTTFVSMFNGCESLTRLDLSNFDTSKSDKFVSMFNNCSSLSYLDISSFGEGGVVSAYSMFDSSNVNLRGLVLGKWRPFTTSDNVGLPEHPENGNITKGWIGQNNRKIYSTTKELINKYDGSEPDTYVWAVKGNITVKYCDENGDIIGDNEHTLFGYVGDDYDVSTEDYQVFIPGYHLDTSNLPENMIGQIAEEPQEIIYRYIKDKTAVNVHDSTLYVGDDWSAKDNFDSALDKDGQAVDFKDVKVSGNVDTTKAGSYEITYSYDGVESKAIITVKDKQTALNVHDSTLYVGDEWSAEDNFDSALDKDGQAVDFKDVKVSGNVDTTKAGSYEITYSYDGVESKAVITVKAKQTAVNVHDSTLYVGDTWSAEDNFDSALDKDGQAVDFKDVKVSGNVDTTKAGSYEITYSYDGLEDTAIVTVLEIEVEQDLTHIVVHDSELQVGENWSPEDNFDEATLSDGKEENFSDIIVNGTVDTKKPGTYEVTYSIPEEHLGRNIVEGYHTATAKIVVTEEKDKDDREPNSKGENSDSDKDNSSSTDNTSGKNDFQNTKGLPKTGEHTSALIFMMGIAFLVLGSVFSVLHIKKNKK